MLGWLVGWLAWKKNLSSRISLRQNIWTKLQKKKLLWLLVVDNYNRREFVCLFVQKSEFSTPFPLSIFLTIESYKMNMPQSTNGFKNYLFFSSFICLWNKRYQDLSRCLCDFHSFFFLFIFSFLLAKRLFIWKQFFLSFFIFFFFVRTNQRFMSNENSRGFSLSVLSIS